MSKFKSLLSVGALSLLVACGSEDDIVQISSPAVGSTELQNNSIIQNNSVEDLFSPEEVTNNNTNNLSALQGTWGIQNVNHFSVESNYITFYDGVTWGGPGKITVSAVPSGNILLVNFNDDRGVFYEIEAYIDSNSQERARLEVIRIGESEPFHTSNFWRR